MVPFWLSVIISILLGVSLTIACHQAANKWLRNAAFGGISGFFLGVLLVFFLLFYPPRIYVVTAADEYVHYINFWSSEYTTKNGETITLKVPSGKSMVINETDDFIIIEEVIYGGIFGGDTYWVKAMSSELANSGTIDYFFDDEPPDEISVDSSADEVTRIWVRMPRN